MNTEKLEDIEDIKNFFNELEEEIENRFVGNKADTVKDIVYGFIDDALDSTPYLPLHFVKRQDWYENYNDHDIDDKWLVDGLEFMVDQGLLERDFSVCYKDKISVVEQQNVSIPESQIVYSIMNDQNVVNPRTGEFHPLEDVNVKWGTTDLFTHICEEVDDIYSLDTRFQKLVEGEYGRYKRYNMKIWEVVSDSDHKDEAFIQYKKDGNYDSCYVEYDKLEEPDRLELQTAGNKFNVGGLLKEGDIRKGDLVVIETMQNKQDGIFKTQVFEFQCEMDEEEFMIENKFDEDVNWKSARFSKDHIRLASPREIRESNVDLENRLNCI